MDIVDNNDAYILVADLPEVKKEDLRVHTEGTSIACFSGNRVHTFKNEAGNLLVAERGFGHFERCFELPSAVDESGVKASFKDQQLRLTIPKLNKASSSSASSSVPIN